MPWMSDVDAFVEECAKVRDEGVFRKELATVPADRWVEVSRRLKERLDNVVPGEPESPPLTGGEGRGVEVLSERQLEQQVTDLEAKRQALRDEDRRRGG
jgi:hypothetical protein